MEIDREALLLAVKAASSVMAASHSVPIFSKVWLMKGHVLAFNNTGMVFYSPIDMPAIGGVDGKLLAQLLDRTSNDTITLENEGANKVRFKVGRSTATLAVMSPVEYVTELGTLPELSGPLAIPCADLGEEIELEAMLNVASLKNEQAVDFSSLCVYGQEGKLTMYASDRHTISRSILKVEDAVETVRFLLPLDFLRVLRKLWPVFGEGMLLIDEETVMASVDEGPTLYTKLAHTTQPIDFKSAIDRMWPEGKIDTKLLVEIPEGLPELLTRAALFAKDEEGVVGLVIEDGRLTVTSRGPAGNFQESIKFKHPPQNAYIKIKPLLTTIKFADRLWLANRSSGIALFGPKRFSRFIAATSTRDGGSE